MILSSALMNSRFAADFGLRKRENFQFLTYDAVICEAIELNENLF